ncbi:hypothetical protein WJX72_000663 [[Myrmecia] bisecta]|uniref:Uncharacterized protein n=1 Tax=[Myrmecia] bisecta TaxID=41462 RepID=A0AAW1Q6E1_9CHLO
MPVQPPRKATVPCTPAETSTARADADSDSSSNSSGADDDMGRAAAWAVTCCVRHQWTATKWAKDGACAKNPNFIMGGGGLAVGACRLSRSACESCRPGDQACWHRNRARSGSLLDDQEGQA